MNTQSVAATSAMHVLAPGAQTAVPATHPISLSRLPAALFNGVAALLAASGTNTLAPGQTETRERMADASAAATTPRLRVLLFTNSVAIGGMEKHVELIAQGLDRASTDVFGICPDWQPIDAWAATLAQSTDHSVRITPDRRYGVVALARETYRFWRQVRAWRVQVMHMHLTTYAGGIWALLAARAAGVRVIVCTEHLAPEHAIPWAPRTLRNLFTRALDQLVCVSLKNRQARESWLYTPDDKTAVVTNGIDVTPFEPTPAEQVEALRASLGIPSGAPIVGTVVRFEEEKGLNYLLDAMPQVLAAAPSTHLLMVGDGSLRGALEQQAADLGISDRVVFAGFQADPRPYLSLMNAFVLPVPVGSASIGLLEAMAMRRAVIMTFGGKGEAVEDGESGLCPPPRDPASLGAAIVRVVCDPVFERHLGENARRRIESAFSSQSVANALRDLYGRRAAAGAAAAKE